MSKDRLTRNPLFQRTQEQGKAKVRKPKAPEPEPVQAPQDTGLRRTASKGLQPGYTRATLIVREEHLKAIKDISYWERINIKQVIEQAFSLYLKDRKTKEHKGGK